MIDDTSLPLEVRQEARKGRGAAYLARGTKNDINKALIDQKAAGLPGIQLTIRSASADLKVVSEITGKLRQNQSVLVTHIQGDWLWVATVDGSDKLKGYIVFDAVTAPSIKPEPPKTNIIQQSPGSNLVQQPFISPNQQAAVYPDQGTQQNSNGRMQQGKRPNSQNGSGPKSIWETPEWETPAQIREGRRNGTLK